MLVVTRLATSSPRAAEVAERRGLRAGRAPPAASDEVDSPRRRATRSTIRSELGYREQEPDPPRQRLEQLPSLPPAHEREQTSKPSAIASDGAASRRASYPELDRRLRHLRGIRDRTCRFLSRPRADAAIWLDRMVRQPDRLLTRAVRPRGARDPRRLPHDRDAAPGPPRLREGPARHRERRRRPRDRRCEPDRAPLPAARGAHRRPPGAAGPRHRRAADRRGIGRRATRSSTRSRRSSLLRLVTGIGEAMRLRRRGDRGHRPRPRGAARRGRQPLLARGLGRARHRAGPRRGRARTRTATTPSGSRRRAARSLARSPGSRSPRRRPATAGPPARRPARPPGGARAGARAHRSAFGFAGFNAFVALYARELGLAGAGWVFFVYSAIVDRRSGSSGGDFPTGSARSARRAPRSRLLAAGLLTIGRLEHAARAVRRHRRRSRRARRWRSRR